MSNCFSYPWERLQAPRWLHPTEQRTPVLKVTRHLYYTENWKHTLTSWTRVLLEKLTVAQLVKKFSALYETTRFFRVFYKVATGP
jgi:hypothetical protein